ncbi:aquaporin-8a.1 [Megalops cyprinoides]|uniref:aquaporin-8a.1 n=1 Tax=Megalops cyprinoides TaxID=118141 RepID=UPI0018644424|nr:aquaporin-8a.1 [Megalops cyprinoides]
MSATESKTELFNIGTVDTAEPEQERAGARGKAHIFERYLQPCVAELLGSALFIFVGCTSVIENAEGTGRLQPALAHGLALAVVIAVFGEISGGHFNPAVSLAVYLTGGLRILLLLPYILAQMFGGMIGAGLAKAIASSESYANASGAAFNAVKNDSQVGAATVAEMVMTLFLTTVVCMGAVNGRTRSSLAPLCIGLTVAADILAGGAVSGACMNPARAFGPAVVVNHWDYHWIYWVGPLTGALLTASFVRLLLGDQKTRVVLK